MEKSLLDISNSIKMSPEYEKEDARVETHVRVSVIKHTNESPEPENETDAYKNKEKKKKKKSSKVGNIVKTKKKKTSKLNKRIGIFT